MSLVVIGNFILFNLFLAILLAQFDSNGEDEDESSSEEEDEDNPI